MIELNHSQTAKVAAGSMLHDIGVAIGRAAHEAAIVYCQVLADQGVNADPAG